MGADPNEGTVHSWRPWNGDFQDVLSGFIPTTKIEGRFSALAFAYVSFGGTIAGPDHDITLASILKRDKQGNLVPDATEFFHQYVPMRQSLMPTSNFLLTPRSRILKNVNDDPSLRSSVLLDLNALSTPGHNPWLNRIGIPGGEGGVIATFATGAREKSSFLDFIIPGQINENRYIKTVTGVRQKSGKRGRFLPLIDLLEAKPTLTSVRNSLFLRVGDTELKQPLAGDGNAPFTSYLSTFSGDPNVDLVKWGNGPPPPNIPADVVWNRQTDYPVYHDVFFYNPDVRALVVSVITGIPTAAEPVTFDDLDLISETP